MKRPVLLFLALFLLGSALRIVAYQQLEWFFGQSLHVDEITYRAGDSPPFERPPGMYLLASVSDSIPTLRLLFSVISMIPALVLFLFREKSFKNALLAGILALEPTLAFSGLQVLPSAPAAVLLSLSICTAEKNGLLSGFAAGCSSLFRGEILLFLPISFFLYRSKDKWARPAIGFATAVLPVMLVNAFSGGPFATAENGSLNLWLGSSWDLLETPPGLEYEQLVGGDSFTDRALSVISSSPLAWAGRGFVKTAAFLSIPGPGRNIEAPVLLGGTFLHFLLPLTGILLALGIAGAGRNIHTAFLITGLASAFVFFPSMRHRAVYIPALVFSASSLRWKPAIPVALLVIILSLFLSYPAEVRAGLTQVQQAQNLLERGEFDRAVVLLEEAGTKGYEGADLHSIMGACIASSGGEFNPAFNEFSRALEIAPESPTAWKNMAALLWNYGYREDAVFAAEKAVSLNPGLRQELAPVLD